MGITELNEEFWQGSAGSTSWAFGSVGSISWGLGSVRSRSWGLGSVGWSVGSRSRGWGASDSVVRSIGSCGSVTVNIFPGSLVFFFLLLWAFSLSPSCFLFRPLFLAGSFAAFGRSSSVWCSSSIFSISSFVPVNKTSNIVNLYHEDCSTQHTCIYTSVHCTDICTLKHT